MSKNIQRRYRFDTIQTLALMIDGFRMANRGNATRHRAATAALSWLECAYLAYGQDERRAYVVKAQNAFRLAFL